MWHLRILLHGHGYINYHIEFQSYPKMSKLHNEFSTYTSKLKQKNIKLYVKKQIWSKKIQTSRVVLEFSEFYTKNFQFFKFEKPFWNNCTKNPHKFFLTIILRIFGRVFPKKFFCQNLLLAITNKKFKTFEHNQPSRSQLMLKYVKREHLLHYQARPISA